jgi:dephospho-CoA kinase
MKRVLITGMSGTGKSTVILELAARGYKAVDLDSDEFSEWTPINAKRGTDARAWQRLGVAGGSCSAALIRGRR